MIPAEGEALHGIRVIDLSQMYAGPYCTKLMAGFGADVIKIEPPHGGDRLRRIGPFLDEDKADPESSIPFLWLNTGKRSITLDLQKDKSAAILRGLISGADVVVESKSPDLQALGLDYESLRQLNPRLVVTSISEFGSTGPYRDFVAEEMQLQALSGQMHMTGAADRPPLTAGPAMCQYTAGLHAYMATLLAVFQRGETGTGQHVEISIQESALENVELALTNRLHNGTEPRRGPHLGVPWDTYDCADGHATVVLMPARHWRRAGEFLPDTELFHDKYAHIRDRIADRQHYETRLQEELRKHKKHDLFREAQSRGLAFGFVSDLDGAIALEQNTEREFFEELDHPVAGTQRYCGAPFKLSATPWKTTAACLLGKDNDAVYGSSLGFDDKALKQLREEGVI